MRTTGSVRLFSNKFVRREQETRVSRARPISPPIKHKCAAASARGDASCYTVRQLRALAARENVPLRRGDTKRDVVARLSAALGSDQTKWPVPHRDEAFAPRCPRTWGANEREWLSNLDIEAVMTQYAKRYPSFRFLGVHPIDFGEVLRGGRCVSMCQLPSVNQARYGAIFNLDKHDESGSHWVAAYVDTRPRSKNYGVYYYDSTAQPIPSEIDQWARKIVAQQKDPKFGLNVNRERRQFKHTECGMFCMRFIIECVRGRAFRDVVHDPIYDDDVQLLRQHYYRCPEISSMTVNKRR
jgi:hypothetical protein